MMTKKILGIAALTLVLFSGIEGQKNDHFGYDEPSAISTVAVANTPAANTTKAEVNAEPVNETVIIEEPKTIKKAITDNGEWNNLLQKYVSADGKVNYKGLLNHKNEIADLVAKWSSLSIDAMSRDEKLAYWINLYNLCTVHTILEHYPIKSIMDISNGKVFDEKRFSVRGEKLSLNDIENVKIRPVFKEPRIHFAVNCAAVSCPPLKNSAWKASTLEQDLEARTKAFINNTSYNKLSKSKVQLSKIFEWYAVDFPSDILDYVRPYSAQTIGSKAKVSYLEYDWALNSK